MEQIPVDVSKPLPRGPGEEKQKKKSLSELFESAGIVSSGIRLET